MLFLRPDLDSKLIKASDKFDPWLVFHGRRHRIRTWGIYLRLFGPEVSAETRSDIDEIARGPDIDDRACLVRGAGSLSIYLLLWDQTQKAARHFIPTYESWRDFGFADAAVLDIPSIAVRSLTEGRPITSAADRKRHRR